MATYTIQKGDTLSSIAQKYNTDINTLMKLNPQITNPNLIYAGTTLNLPSSQPTVASTTSGAYINPITQKSYPIGVASPGYTALGQPISQQSQQEIKPTTTIIQPTNNPNVYQPPTSQVQSQAAAILAQIQQLQKQVEEAKAAGYSGREEIKYDAQGNIIPKTTAQRAQSTSIWDKLLGKQQELEQKIASMPTAEELVNQQLSKWGITPETFTQMNNLSAQLGEINKQIANLNAQEQQALMNIEGKPISLELMTKKQQEISRLYAIKRADLTGQASAIGTQLSALQGNFNLAKSMASLTIEAVLTGRKQMIDDLKWADDFYRDIILAMEESERDIWKTNLAYQDKLYQQQRADLETIGKLVSDPDTAKAFLNYPNWAQDYLAGKFTVEDAYRIAGQYVAIYPRQSKTIVRTGYRKDLQDALNVLGSPEAAANAVWNERRDELYDKNIKWTDLLEEAYTLKPQQIIGGNEQQQTISGSKQNITGTTQSQGLWTNLWKKIKQLFGGE